MQIHLFISDLAPGRSRLKRRLEDIMKNSTNFMHEDLTKLKKINLAGYDEPIASVIMPASQGELYPLSQFDFFKDRSKNLFILPEEDPELFELANTMRPVFIAGENGNFSDIVLILNHLKSQDTPKSKNKQINVHIYKLKGGM